MSSSDGRWLITGGIGSGKSEVRRLLAVRGIHAVDADAVGHLVLADEGLTPVAERWPDVVLEGQIDRQALARIVFDDPGELEVLEAITHPLIFGRIEADLKGFSGVAVVEMPLLETSMGWPMVVVDADDETRRARAVQRGMDDADVRRRMASQPSRAEWLAAAAVVVPNHDEIQHLEAAVDLLADFLLGKLRTDLVPGHR
ncbi:MAG TPA: dephospho-CoA kinase [Acidimicrobiia bacterium]|nr:dephospho-CoA kinase [Acidimicrobiia bacterium]